MQTIPHAPLVDDRGAARRQAAPRWLRELVGRDRATRPSCRTAGVTGTGASALPAPVSVASGRPVVRTLLRAPHPQRSRAVAGLSLAVFVPLAIGVLNLLPSFRGETLPGFGCLLAVIAAALVGGRVSGFVAAASGFLVLAFLLVRPGDGTEVHAQEIVAVLGFGGAAVAVAYVVAGQQAARTALAYSERRYRTLVEELPLVTYVARVVDSTVEYVSPQIERLLELTPEQALEKHDFWTPRLHPLDRDRILRDWRAWCADATGEPFRRTYRMLTETGRTIWVDDVTVLESGRTNGAAYFQRHLLDVSEQRVLEEQLREGQKFEALGRLAGGVAHDFNNLLAVIGGYSKRLADRSMDGAQHESALAIGAAADRGTALVRQLLSFSRPQPTERRLIDLNTIVGDFVPMLRRVIGEDVELELAFERQPLPVEVDPARVDQVLMNLVVNARDAMPEGGRLTIATAADEETADDGASRRRSAVLTVSDTGPGIDVETRERIFEPFFTTKSPGKGTGLGLATAYGIVNQAGGVLAVSSDPGQGTTFAIRLPLAAADLEPAVEPAAPAAAPCGGREVVLLVEDEAALRDLEQVTLEDAGYHVHAAADATAALELARRHAFDLVLVDVVMPGLSGPQLVDELRKRGSALPAIYVSGYGADEFASRGIDVGNGAVVQKPFHADTLLGKVRDVLDGAASAPKIRRPVRSAIMATVRCLACGARYRRAETAAGPSCCPRCEYVGWAEAE
jgi:PAS domain S-box-containing protein